MSSTLSMFNTQYDEFCTDLEGACPELSSVIAVARALPPEIRIKRFQAEVSASPKRDTNKCPGCVLPGVNIPAAVWKELSENTRKAIQEYLTLMTMCSLYSNLTDLSGNDSGEFLKGFLDSWKTKLEGTDFKKLTEKFADFLKGAATSAAAGAGAAGGAAAGGLPGMPSLPEKFLKGHIARLAEDLVREFRPEEFGLGEDEIRECEKNPMRAFEILLQAYTTKPEVLQGAMKKIAKRMQEKIQRGELRPQDLAAEAEEILKECTDNPAFREMMEGFRTAFGFEDMDTARQQGREGNARLSLVRNRLRAKLEKRKDGKK